MQNRENSAQRLCQIAISSQRSSHTPLGAEALAVGLGPQGKDRAECCEKTTPRGLM